MSTATALRTIATTTTHPVVRQAFLDNVVKVSNACSACGLSAVCRPCGARVEESDVVDTLFYSRRRVKRGEFLYRAGDRFHALYTFRTGFFKSYVTAEDGRTHVTGFQMPGEIMGLDGIEDERHSQDVVALEDAEVCVIPYARLAELAVRRPELAHHLHRMMSREIVREQGLMLLLGTMCAEARVAAFLLNLSERFADRGYSAREFNLRMTREEIGSYLGLKLETVSRVLSRLQERGLITAHNRSIGIVDTAGLHAQAGRA
jgi:CRP/FNR family transcriptional regulator